MLRKMGNGITLKALIAANVLAFLSLFWLLFFNPPPSLPFDQLIEAGADQEYFVVESRLVRNSAVLTSFTERPIFHTDRRAFIEPVLAVAPETMPDEQPLFQLVGVVLRKDGASWAYIQKNSDDAVIRIERGQDLDGWQIAHISEEQVILTKNGRSVELGIIGD